MDRNAKWGDGYFGGPVAHAIPGRVFYGACIKLMEFFRVRYHMTDSMYIVTCVLNRSDGTPYAVRIDGFDRLIPIEAIYKVI